MKIMTYIFWRFYRFNYKKNTKGLTEEKDKQDVEYFGATIIFGLIVFFPIIAYTINRILKIDNTTHTRLEQTLIWGVLLLPLTLFVRLAFPKKKIIALEYTKEERRSNNLKILAAFALLIAHMIYSHYMRNNH